MERIAARILAGKLVLAKNISVWIHEETDRTGLQSWHGQFGVTRIPEPIYSDQGPFRIELADGRSGEFLVKEIDLLARPVTISITSVGPLK